jgi:hypothetical protein
LSGFPHHGLRPQRQCGAVAARAGNDVGLADWCCPAAATATGAGHGRSALSLWSTSAMRTIGDDIAEALALLNV